MFYHLVLGIIKCEDLLLHFDRCTVISSDFIHLYSSDWRVRRHGIQQRSVAAASVAPGSDHPNHTSDRRRRSTSKSSVSSSSSRHWRVSRHRHGRLCVTDRRTQGCTRVPVRWTGSRGPSAERHARSIGCRAGRYLRPILHASIQR